MNARGLTPMLIGVAMLAAGCTPEEVSKGALVLAQSPDIVPDGFEVRKVVQSGQPDVLVFSAKVKNMNTNPGAKGAPGPFKVKMRVLVTPAPPPAYANVIYDANATKLLTSSDIVGPGQTISVVVVESTDGGRTWAKGLGPWGVVADDSGWDPVVFTDERRGFVGYTPALFSTSDGGTGQWERTELPVPAKLHPEAAEIYAVVTRALLEGKAHEFRKIFLRSWVGGWLGTSPGAPRTDLPRSTQKGIVRRLEDLPPVELADDRLMDELWDGEPPRTAATSLQNMISALRKLLGREHVVTRPPGYLLDVDPRQLDVGRLQRRGQPRHRAPDGRRDQVHAPRVGAHQRHRLGHRLGAVAGIGREADARMGLCEQ